MEANPTGYHKADVAAVKDAGNESVKMKFFPQGWEGNSPTEMDKIKNKM